MFRAAMCPSSGNNCCIYATLVFVTLYGWLLVCWLEFHSTHTEWQIPASHRYSNFSWWWAHGCPKHVEKRNKCTKQNRAPNWIYLQDNSYCSLSTKYPHLRRPPKTQNKWTQLSEERNWCRIYVSWFIVGLNTWRCNLHQKRSFGVFERDYWFLTVVFYTHSNIQVIKYKVVQIWPGLIFFFVTIIAHHSSNSQTGLNRF